jgi:hypothetical protein
MQKRCYSFLSISDVYELVERNRYRDGGFLKQMIRFLRMNKVMQDGKPVWELRNGDLSAHIPKSPIDKLQNIESTTINERPPARPQMIEPCKCKTNV